MDRQERDSYESGFDSLARRIFRPSTMSRDSAAEKAMTSTPDRGQTVAGNRAYPTGPEKDMNPADLPPDAELYMNTFGRSRSDSESMLSSSGLDPRSKGKGKSSEEDGDGPGKRPDSRSMWTEQQTGWSGEGYVTPLSPRVQERERKRALQQGASSSTDTSLGLSDFTASTTRPVGPTEVERERKSSKRRRSTSLDDDLSISNNDSYSGGYRRMEKALEARQLRELSEHRSSTAIVHSSPAIEPAVGLGEAASANQVNVPTRSSSKSRGSGRNRLDRSGAAEVSSDSRKGNVTFRSRALSAPSSSLDSGLESRRRRRSEEGNGAGPSKHWLQRRQASPHQSQEASSIYQPVRTRPLSLPTFAPPIQSASAANRTAFVTQSPGLASSLVMPWDPAQSTALSLRHAMGADGGLSSFDNPRLRSTSARPSLHLGILSLNRAQARYHLGALSAMRARIPSDSTRGLAAIQFRGWVPRLHHLLLSLLTYAHVAATIFFDYNTLYSIVQVAVHPDAEGSSAAWWIATGIYSASLLTWALGVVLMWEMIIEYRRRWMNPRPFALPIYLSSSAFTLTSIRSYSLYSLLYRARLSASRRDFLIESFWFYSQNWPTVLTLLPRGIILTVFLVLYNPVSGSRPAPNEARDSVYFSQSTGALTNFSFIVLVINAAWMAWRAGLLVAAYAGLLATLGSSALYEAEKTSYEWQDSDSALGALPLTNLSASPAALKRQTNRFAPANEGQVTRGTGGEHLYSSVDIQDSLREGGEDKLLFPSRSAVGVDQRPLQHQQQQPARLQQGAQDRAVIPNVQLPRWAWRGRAEERLLALLMQSEQGGLGTPDPSHPWPLSPTYAGLAEEQRGPPSAAAMQTSRAEMGRPLSQGPGQRLAEGSQAGGSDSSRVAEASPSALPAGSMEAASLSPSRGQSPPLSIPRFTSTTPSELSSGAGRSDVLTRNTSDRPYSGAAQTASSRATLGQERISGDQGRSSEEEQPSYPFPTNSGDHTPRHDEQSALVSAQPEQGRDSVDTPPLQPFAPAASSATAMSSTLTSDTIVPTKKSRPSSSLTSLAESLRFLRSNRSVDNVEGDGKEAGPGSAPAAAAAAPTATAAPTNAKNGGGTWWTGLFKGRGEVEEPQELSTSAEGEVLGAEGVAGEPGEAGEAGEKSSEQTHETGSTEDSEERRLWSEFPEQSRRYPPGLIALNLEQRRLAAGGLPEDSKAKESSHQYSPAALHETAGDEGGLGDKNGDESAASMSEGLRPIKEESWSSSLDSAANSYTSHGR